MHRARRSTRPTRRAAATCCSQRSPRCKPDIVVIEAYPFGRRQMRFELLPLLDAIAAMTPKPALVTSVRDILQERVKAGRNEETVEIVNRHFDLVMVHGDPAFASLGDTFPLARQITAEIAYTGLVAAPRPAPSPERYDVLISVGGGAAGRLLVDAAVSAAQRLSAGKALVPDHRPQPAASRFRRGMPPRRRRTSRSSASARTFRRCLARPSCPSRKPATIRSAISCKPAAARSWCRSRPAARPSRRCAPSGCSGSGWHCRCPRMRCRRQAWRQRSSGSSPCRSPARTGSTSTARESRQQLLLRRAAGETVRPPRSA